MPPAMPNSTARPLWRGPGSLLCVVMAGNTAALMPLRGQSSYKRIRGAFRSMFKSWLRFFSPAIHVMLLTLTCLAMLIPCFSAHAECVSRVRNHDFILWTSNLISTSLTETATEGSSVVSFWLLVGNRWCLVFPCTSGKRHPHCFPIPSDLLKFWVFFASPYICWNYDQNFGQHAGEFSWSD